MGKTREIKGRMKAVSNIKRITKTMQLIATARFQAAQKRATSAKPYTQKIAELVGELASAGGDVDHPLLKEPQPKTGRELLLVITANRGLCGGYNANILRTAVAHLREKADQKVELEIAGKKGVAYFKFVGKPMAKIHTQFGDKPSFQEVHALAQEYMKAFESGQYDAVRVVYMAFESVSRQKPVVIQLLPMEKPKVDESAKNKATVEYDFMPEPAKLLAELLPVTVKTRLFQAFNEAIVGEQVARMIAMKAATDAAGKMGKALARKYNRARQTAITTELTEIIGGTAALE
ncbi:MAG: ATP synthase F1 subunit gamma [Phycisphaeraceae bacterium]